MKKRILSTLLSLALCLSLLPAVSLTALAADAVSYVEYSWNSDTSTLSSTENTTSDYTVVDAATTEWADGKTYVVNGTVNIGQRVTIEGSVSLILTDGCELTVNGGIEVLDNETLTIYAQSGGTGKLTATASGDAAGIGGTNSQNGGAVNVHGGTVTATASGKGSGIGGSSGNMFKGAGGTVNVYNGSVTATGITGIGGGYGAFGSGGTTNVYGGFVTATAKSDGSGNSGAGIGGVGFGGVNNSASSTNIYGGVVTAIGSDGYWERYNIYNMSAGIGGGYSNEGGTVMISGGIINAEAGESAAAIGNGQDGDYVTVKKTGGMIFENNSGKLHETTFTLPVDYSTPDGKTLTVAKNQTLVIPAGMTLTVNGPLVNNGTIENNGTLILAVPAGKVSGSGRFSGSGKFIITAITADDITVPENIVYNAQDYTNDIKILETTTILGTDFTYDLTGWTRSFDPSPVYNAGEYTVMYTHPTHGSVTKTFSVAKANPGIGTVSYTGGTLYEGFAGSSVVLSCRRTSIPGTLALTDERLTAGTTTYNWQFTPEDTVNYESVTGTIDLEVETDEVVSIAASGTPAKTAYVYGDAFELDGVTVTATYSKGGTKDVTALVTFGPLAVGQTEVTLTYGDNMTCTVDGITVAKKGLDVSGMRWSVPTGDDAVYDGKPKSVGLEGTLPEGVTAATSGNLSAINAGDYTATATFSLADGYSGDNYEIVGTNPLTANWEITKATMVLPNVERRFIRTIATTGNMIDVASMLPDDADKVGSFVRYTVTSSSYSVLENVSVSNGKLSFDTITSDTTASDVITVRVSMQNYKTATLTVNVFLDDKTPQEITGVSAATDLIYNGAPRQGYTGAPTSDYTGDYEITYTGRDNGYNSTVAPTNAGDYTVTFKIPDSDLYYSGSVSVNFTIGKAPVTVTADDKQMYTGSDLPELTCTVDGLVGSDTLDTAGLTMKYQRGGVDVAPADVDVSTAGAYDIVISGAADSSGNYAVTHTNGTLTISTRPVYADPTYKPTVEESDNGSVTVSPKNPEQGDKVTVTTDPDKSYEVGEITVTDSKGNPVEVIDNGDGTYSFVQPRGKVTITVTYQDEKCEGTKEDSCQSLAFTDLDPAAWYHEYVDYVIENDLMGSTSATENTFSPYGTVTRAQVVTVLWRLEGEPASDYAMSFEDVSDGKWYTEAIRWAASEEIVLGYNGKFNPNDPITREQLATILWRYAKYKGYDVSFGEDTNILSYNDASGISQWAIPAMQWACGSGLVQGDGVSLTPKADATRAQAAALFRRFCGLSK